MCFNTIIRCGKRKCVVKKIAYWGDKRPLPPNPANRMKTLPNIHKAEDAFPGEKNLGGNIRRFFTGFSS